MQKLPFIKKHFKKYLLLYLKAFESFKMEGFDVVLSSSSFAKGIIPYDGTCHICYCHNPMRFVWDYQNYIERENLNKIFIKLLPYAIRVLKRWDLKTNKKVNYFIANSNNISKRIKKYYNRKSTVIYPPVDTSKFIISNKIEDYFLVVARLNSYKRIDLVVEAFNKNGLNLKIVGDGPYRNKLEELTVSKNIEFL